MLVSNTPRRFAAIADIHGNSDALRAVLADIDSLGIETIVNLGDHVSGPLAARETIDILMDRPMLSIRGNHDRWVTTLKPDEMGFWDRAAYGQMEAAHLAWLAKLPASATLGEGVFLCHATPSNDNRYWMEEVDPDGGVRLRPLPAIEAEAEGVGQSLILCAHTHVPRVLRLSDGRMLVNPGSVGCPAYDDDHPVPHVIQTGTPDACYAVLEQSDDRWRVTLRHVPYDPARMIMLAQQAGRPEWARALATGWM